MVYALNQGYVSLSVIPTCRALNGISVILNNRELNGISVILKHEIGNCD